MFHHLLQSATSRQNFDNKGNLKYNLFFKKIQRLAPDLFSALPSGKKYFLDNIN